jgi:hypothetical protein
MEDNLSGYFFITAQLLHNFFDQTYIYIEDEVHKKNLLDTKPKNLGGGDIARRVPGA